jgi:hypothetical protein
VLPPLDPHHPASLVPKQKYRDRKMDRPKIMRIEAALRNSIYPILCLSEIPVEKRVRHTGTCFLH